MSCKVQKSVCSDCVTYVKSRIKFNTFNTFNNVEYIDFTKKKIELHKEVENAIKNIMTEKGVTEIDLTLDEEHYDAGWVIRRVENASELEEVQVAYIKLYGNSLFYKGESAWEIDEEWIPFDVTDNILAGCIDSVYDAIYQRI